MAQASLALALLSVLVGAGSALASFISRRAQYVSFVAGFQSLRALGAVQVAAQAALATWLSFWMTAIWFNSYYVKLILGMGLLALFAVGAVLKSLFHKPDEVSGINGVRLDESQAPQLFERVRALATRQDTAPPDQILAGIDDNFFVTETQVECAGEQMRGRTLYVSLSLLRALSRDEADAVLAHEMAHFSGGDTLHSRKLMPAMSRFDTYLDALSGNALALPVFLFLLAWRSLFELSFGKSRREREFAADASAARLVSADALGSALVRVAAYSNYRARVENELFASDRVHDSLAIADRVATGFATYAGTGELRSDLLDSVTPHPFDSHPPLLDRLTHVGSRIAPEDFATILAAPVTENWCDGIVDAEALEGRQWRAYEEQFGSVHELVLAHRYLPEGSEERELVLRHFPAVSFGGEQKATLSCTEVDGPGLEAALPLGEIIQATIDDRMFKKHLDLQLQKDSIHGGTRSLQLSALGTESAAFLDAFGRYWNRARSAAQYRADARAEKEQKQEDSGSRRTG